MKGTQQLHRAQLLTALSVKPHTLRAWLSLEPLASRPTEERSANAYSPVDFLFLVVVQQLSMAGLELEAMKSFSQELHRRLGQPARKDDTLPVFLDGGRWKPGVAPAGSETLELRVPLAPARRQVLEYTGAPIVSGQREIALLTSVRAGTRGRRA